MLTMFNSLVFHRLIRRNTLCWERTFFVAEMISEKDALLVISWATHTRENLERENDGYLKFARKYSLFCLDAEMFVFGLLFV